MHFYDKIVFCNKIICMDCYYEIGNSSLHCTLILKSFAVYFNFFFIFVPPEEIRMRLFSNPCGLASVSVYIPVPLESLTSVMLFFMKFCTTDFMESFNFK